MVSAAAAEGGQFLQLGLLRDAIQAFEKGLAKNAHDEGCLIGLIRAGLSVGDPEPTRSAIARLLAVHPDHSEALSHLAMLEMQQGDPAALGKLEALSLAPGAGFFEHYNLANVLQARGEDARAEAAFARALDRAPDNAFVRVELGQYAMKRQDAPAAIAHLARACELMPNEWVPVQLHARALALDGQLGKAVAVLKAAIEIFKDVSPLYQELYKYCMAAGSPKSACYAAQELRRIKPDDPDPEYLQGLAHLTLGELPKAKKLFEMALRKLPRSWELKQALAKTYLLLKDEAGALKLLEEANASAPHASGPANDLALLYLEKEGQAAKAQAVLKPVVENSPDDLAARLNLALALVQLGKKAEAAPHLEKAKASSDSDIREQALRLQKQLR